MKKKRNVRMLETSVLNKECSQVIVSRNTALSDEMHLNPLCAWLRKQ